MDIVGAEITILCADGIALGGHLWESEGPTSGTVIVNPATGVLARYYHYYARWLASRGLTVITYDYRGIGLSRPPRLRGSGILWRHWGERDFEAVVRFARARDPDGLLAVVGHSIGGFLIGFAPSAARIDRILTVGAQYAYWRDYAAGHRGRLYLRWHFVMPLLTALFGYFPGKRLRWLEDLPAGVANEWSFRRARMEQSYPRADRAAIVASFAAVQAPILALSMTDDDYATDAALRRSLSYYSGSDRRVLRLPPEALGLSSVGHFSLFHSRHTQTFWPLTLKWLGEGVQPWPDAADIPPGVAAMEVIS
jgi:predicted alpha/beta hydrolase